MTDHAGARRATTRPDTTMPTLLRTAVPGDHHEIVARLDIEGSTRRLLKLDLAGAKPRNCVVAEDPGGILGFAMSTRQPDEVHLLDITIASAARRRGIARRLLGWLATAAVADGATAMTLEVRHSNTGAQALYLGLGFVDHGLRPGYYQDGEDAMIMWHHDLAGMANDTASAASSSMTRTA